jgi:hypothetical protein
MRQGLIGLILIGTGIIIWILGFFLNLDVLNPNDTTPFLAIIVIGGLLSALGGFVLSKK